MVPTSSAVLLMHNPHGGFPIVAAGRLSGQAAHTIDYDGRKGEYEEKGGCERELTERDRTLSGARQLSAGTVDSLNYDARAGRWAGKGAGAMEDCSYWGQNGPLSREDIERDMLACGGCYLKSVVSVDRRYAAELELDTKEAFQALLRGRWQEAMVAAGVANRAADVRWYACYHTDAENSLHVHVCTWAAGGRIAEGWHPSARATREQKALLYRDAYAPVRTQRNLEQDYYRMLLPKLAAAEMGMPPAPADEERLHAKAERAGVDEIPLERTVFGKGAEEVARRAGEVAERLREGSGRKSSDWKLQSDAGKAVRAIRAASPAFDAALGRYRELIETKADLAGLAVSERAHDPVPHPAGKAQEEREAKAREITRHERDRFVRREMDDVMRRVRNAVIRSADPDSRLRELARREVDQMRHPLVTRSLTPARLGLPPEAADRLRQIYQDAARPGLGEGGERAPMGPERAAEAARIVASSEPAERAAEEAAQRVRESVGGSVDEARVLAEVRAQMAPRIANAIEWRFDTGRVDPGRIEHDRLGRAEESRIARDIVANAVSTRGLSLGISRSAGEELAASIDAARAARASGDGGAEAEHVRHAADIIARSPAMRAAVDEALAREAAAHPHVRVPDRDYVDASAASAVARRVAAHVSGADAAGAHGQADGEQERADAIGLAGLAAMVAAAIVRERSADAGGGRAAGRGGRMPRLDLSEPPEGRTR